MITTDSRYVFIDYNISYDSDLLNDLHHITPEIKDILQATHEKVSRKKNSVIRELQDLIKKYPDVPQFKNQLSAMFARQGNMQQAREANDLLLKAHPHYLFGRINLANQYLADKKYDRVPEALGELMEIKGLYPERDTFHITEVIAFHKCAIAYFIAIGNLEAAESRLKIIKELDFEDEQPAIEWLERNLMMMQLSKGLENFIKTSGKRRKVKAVSKKVVEPTNVKPEFVHAQIERLYCNNAYISSDLIQQILALPRQSLISDLSKVMQDSIARYDYFFNKADNDDLSNFFPVHALLLLTELKAEESLPVVLDVLRQDEEFLDFWFGDILTEVFWLTHYVLGKDKLDVLREFILEPDIYCYARTEVSVAMSQLALHEPHTRNNVLQWYTDVLESFITHKEDNRIIDDSLNALIVGDLIDMEATELEPAIKALYKANIVEEWGAGTLEDVLKDLHEPPIGIEKIKRPLRDIFNIYEKLREWHDSYEEDDDDDIFTDEIDESEFDEYEDVLHIVEERDSFKELAGGAMPVVNNVLKIGRNDPCYCGSGIKYKKCHGKVS